MCKGEGVGCALNYCPATYDLQPPGEGLSGREDKVDYSLINDEGIGVGIEWKLCAYKFILVYLIVLFHCSCFEEKLFLARRDRDAKRKMHVRKSSLCFLIRGSI